MTRELRRLAALAAALAPADAERWLLLLAGEGASASTLAAALARGGRVARVAAVAAALAPVDLPSPRAADAAPHPLLQRLALEESARAPRR